MRTKWPRSSVAPQIDGSKRKPALDENNEVN